MKRIALVGSTGSIGRQVIEVAAAHPDKFKIVAMCACSSAAELAAQAGQVMPEYCALAAESGDAGMPNLPQGVKFFCGEEAALRVADYDGADVVFVAAGGFAGLKYSLAAIRAGKPLALANKETLVCGGDLVMPLAQERCVPVIPVDSEHSAIWQCLQFDAHSPLKNLIITASGGAFRDYPPERLSAVTPEQALCHPTWKMGKKITIDSATLLNKGYEVIEAHHLYGTPYGNIKTVIQRESIVHSMVEFADGAILAQMSNPSMILPIQLALTYPQRMACALPEMDFCAPFALHFEPLIRKKYPCYDLALTCGEAGGTLPCALNAAGEEAVYAFLRGQIGFLRIAEVMERVIGTVRYAPVESYGQLCEVDLSARREAAAVIRSM